MDSSGLLSRASGAYIPPHRTQLHPRMHSFNSPFASAPQKASSSSWQSRDKYWALAASLLILPFLLYLFAVARGVHLSSKFSDPKPKGFGVIIHAGSAGSTVRVFEFLSEGRIPFVGYERGGGGNSMKSPRTLVEFIDNPEKAGDSIRGLLQFAKEKVPKKERKNTSVRLMATEELGMPPTDARERILESCRRVLRSSGFLFKDEWASAITGQEKGTYAWVAANYALGTLGGDRHETVGVVDLGGTSIQVTWVPREQPKIKYSHLLKLAGVSYNLNSKSIVELGQDALWESLRKEQNARLLKSSKASVKGIRTNPCISSGYYQISKSALSSNANDRKLLEFQAGGNFSICKSEALALLRKNKDSCVGSPCGVVALMHQLHGRSVSSENFVFTSQLFGLVPRASLSDLATDGRHYCETDWGKLRDEYRDVDEVDLSRYCFFSAYTVALLHDELGVPMDAKRIGFANHTLGAAADWTLGAFILQTLETEPESDALSHIVADDSVTFLSLFAILFLAIIGAFYISKWRRPQLKTVYDLEKGHYIVTRVPR